MTDTTHRQRNRPDRDPDDAVRGRLMRGLIGHGLIFTVAITAAFLLNWTTRGTDGGWWVVWLLEIWAFAWGLHLFGVAMRYPRN